MINIIQNTIGALGRTLGIVRKNLQLWLDFERSNWVGGELVVKDKSPNTNNAKLFTGKALSFNGNDSVTDFGNPNVNLKSICFWVHLDTTTEQLFNLTATQSIEAVSGVITLNGTWSNSNIYVDGIATTSIGTTPKRVVVTTDTNILVSDLEFARIGTDYGSLDLADVQIYDTEFTLADALLDYNNPNHLIFDVGGSIALADLKGYWAMSEGDGLVAYDSSGEGNNGTINGATYTPAQDTITQLGMVDWAKSTPVADEVTLIQAPNNKGYDILGNALRLREHAFNLDGSGYAEIADNDSLDMNEGFSVSFWRKLDVSTDGVRSALVTKGVGLSTGTDYGVALSMYTNKIVCDLNTDLGRTFVQKLLTIDGSWVFVTFTYTKNEKSRLYIDTDAPVVSTTISGTINETHSIRVGTDKDLDFKDSALIDEVVWYNRALTQKEITQNYKAGINKHKATSSFSDDFSSDYGI